MTPPSGSFQARIAAGYAFSGPSITLGAAMHEGKAVPQTLVRAPLKTFNRHGLIAGATGTGKTKTLQRLAERSGRSRPAFLTGNAPEVLSSTPPPTSRQAPVIAGRQEMVRTAIPPPAWRFTP